jgi:hypothetical protein
MNFVHWRDDSVWCYQGGASYWLATHHQEVGNLAAGSLRRCVTSRACRVTRPTSGGAQHPCCFRLLFRNMHASYLWIAQLAKPGCSLQRHCLHSVSCHQARSRLSPLRTPRSKQTAPALLPQCGCTCISRLLCVNTSVAHMRCVTLVSPLCCCCCCCVPVAVHQCLQHRHAGA